MTKRPKHENIKEVMIAIFIGACVSFLTTLFSGLADFLQSHAEQIIAGMSYVAYHVARHVRMS